MRRNVHSSAVFANFTWTRPSPSTILGNRKLETLGYPTVKTASLCIPSFCFDTIPECDGRTDERTDEFAVAYTALAKLALHRKSVKRNPVGTRNVQLYGMKDFWNK